MQPSRGTLPMQRTDVPLLPLAPGAHARARQALRRGTWRRLAWTLPALGAAAWWLWPEAPPDPLPANAHIAVEQSGHGGQAWPFGAGAPAEAPRDFGPAGASPWDRLRAAGEADDPVEDQGPDPRQRNAAIPPARLTAHHLLAARAFLDHVVLQPEPRGGFTVEAVLSGSRYERAGLRPGDILYTLDLPGQPVIDESNMAALTSVHELAFEVVRGGGLVRLSVQLNEEVADHGPS